MFCNIDKKLSKIGFEKVKENKFGASYRRKDLEYGYIQCLDLLHKENNYHLIQSYQKDTNEDGFNNVIGLTMYEVKLALKKMKQMGFKIKR